MYKKITILVLILLAIGGFVFFDLGSYLELESLKQNREALLGYYENHSFLTILLFSLAYIVSVFLSLPIATLLTLLGGFLFGSILGTLIVVVSATIGAALIFLAARYLFADWFYSKVPEKYKKLDKEFEENGFNHLLFFRLLPIFPFFALNIIPAFTKMSTRDYTLATLIGIIPGSFVYVYAGRELGMLESISDIASPSVLLAFALLGVLSLIPMVYKKIKARKH